MRGGVEKGKVAWGRGDGSGLEWRGIDFVVGQESWRDGDGGGKPGKTVVKRRRWEGGRGGG